MAKSQPKKKEQPVVIKPPASFYHTKDYLSRLHALSENPGKISFPKPFTFGDYKRYIRAVFANTAEKGIGDESPAETFFREYSGAYEVVQEWGLRGLSRDQASPESDDLPMAVASFLTLAADAYIGPKIIVERLSQTMVRRYKDAHISPEFDTSEMLHLLPDLATYPGKVTFARQLTAKLFRAWDKAMTVKGEYDPRDIENSLLARQYRAARPLIEKWEVEGIGQSDLTESGDGVPMVIVTWLVDCADAYLGYRTNQKKLVTR